jgi:hypothetical protein
MLVASAEGKPVRTGLMILFEEAKGKIQKGKILQHQPSD